MGTLHIEYRKDGLAVADHMCEELILKQVDLCVGDQDKQFNVSTENVIMCARSMMVNGQLPCKLKLMFEGKVLEMNEYAVLVHGWPQGFCEDYQNWLTGVLRGQMKLRGK